MSLLNDILKWTETLPTWQRDATRRLLQKEGVLDSKDYSELYLLVKQENGIEVENKVTAVPLSSEHLPVDLDAGETVTLVELRELENVNRIPNDHAIKFSETGMTVIYGGNGAGKSGYARVIKHACRARGQSETIHPNVNDPNSVKKVPTARFEVKVAGSPEVISWSRDANAPDRLSVISVFDSKCARSYITEEQDVAYLPYGLDIVENLASKVLPKISEKLEEEIRNIDVDKFPFEHLIGDTEVGKAIDSLSDKSDPNEISSLGKITVEDTNRIAELESTLNETDPLSKSNELKHSANRLRSYAEKLSKPLKWLSVEAVENLKKIAGIKEVAEEDETQAADVLRAGETLLPGTGGQSWKRLFEAARRFASEVAFPDGVFPPSTEEKVCPLCQVDLGNVGTKRLRRFDEFIKNDVAKSAEAARETFATEKEKFEKADMQIAAEELLLDELNALNDSLIKTISEFQSSINSRRDSILACFDTSKWEDIPELLESPGRLIRQLAANQFRASRKWLRTSDEETRKKLRQELCELTARQALEKSLVAVLSLSGRMKKKALLEKCRNSLKTRPISDKSKEFASAAITGELKKALDQEFQTLGIGHIRTKLNKRNVKGKMFHQLLLDLSTMKKIDEILSEGEQRSIALASFFAELSLAKHTCGIVFDDPVSSLDHWRRQNVARRLVKEAKVRQVVVFTHDTSFLGQLSDEIESANIRHSMCFLEWQGDSPGCVTTGLPWDHKGYKARIDDLEQAQSKLAKSWPIYPGEKEIRDLENEYNRFRATLERVIQDVVFNGVVQRYRDWIRMDSLEEVVGFNRTEYDAIAKLHKQSCKVVSAHDTSSAKAATVPTPVDLGEDIAALKSIVESIKTRRKATKNAAS